MFALINPILPNIPDNPGASSCPERAEIGYEFALRGHAFGSFLRHAWHRSERRKSTCVRQKILPEVSVIDAILLFRRLGTDVTGMTPEELRETRRRLINRHHPDRGGSLDMAQAINAAFDLLKDGVPKYRGSPFALGSFRRAHQSRRDQLAVLKLCNPEFPEWVWAGCSGDSPGRFDIRTQDFSDINFIKKSLWELSGHSEYEYTIWGFDGRIFRGHVAVFG